MSHAAKVGLAHDYLLVMRGAERTFAEIARCWPGAPIYTSIYSETGTEGRFADRDLTTSRLQRLGLDQGNFRKALPLYRGAFRSLPVEDHGLLVSSSSAFAHQIRPPRGCCHVCYCHAPFRYAWHERDRALREVPRPLRRALAAWLSRARRQDREAALRVDGYIANSEMTKQRIAQAYGREAEIVHPPVEVGRFTPTPVSDYLLVVSELVSHKRIETAIEATRRLGERLLIVGEGPARSALTAIAHPGVEFRGRVSDGELTGLYAGARAVLVTAAEEFGIVAVEAQAAGRPVVAPAAGGAAETVLDGVTGFLLAELTPDALGVAIAELEAARFESAAAVENAARFSPARFRENLLDAVGRLSDEH